MIFEMMTAARLTLGQDEFLAIGEHGIYLIVKLRPVIVDLWPFDPHRIES